MRPLLRFELRLLGGATLLAADGHPLGGRAVHRHRLALLALLALAHPSGMSREKLVGLLWPERDEVAARRLLRAAIHDLRQTLGPAAMEGAGDELHLDPTRVRVDVHAFEEALTAGDLEGAVALYRGPFLDGLFLDDAEEFDGWVTAQRARLARRHEEALETLAERASRDTEHAAAARWWRTLAGQRPADGRVVLRTMEALAAAGDRGGALALAGAHEALLRAEYGTAPDAAVAALAARLREVGTAPTTVADRRPAATYTPEVATRLVEEPAAVEAAGPPRPPASPASVAQATVARASAPVASAPPRRRALRHVVAAVLLIAATLAATLSLRGRDRPLPGRPDALAVVPFDVVGGAPWELREGLPELLSANLDQVAGIRVVPARLSAARARELGGADGGGATPGRIARALGGDAVVTGIVAASRDGLRVVATLIDARDSTLARVEATGEASELPALVDRLSVALLRELWGRRWGVPRPRLAAVSTTSPEALRAYLRGEAFLRQALWDSAASALAQAVDLDSTFALAYLRLAEPYGWRYGMASPPAERALAAAQRFADRLPPRERALLAVRRLHEAGDLAALDSAEALAERYPDDPEAQYVRADVRFHVAPLRGEQHGRLIAASFDTAAALDSNAARVFAHPVSLALERGDSARFDRAVARLTALSSGSHVQVAARPDYALLRRVRWSAPAAAHRTLVARLRAASPPPTWEVEDLLQAIERACLTAATPEPALLLDAYDATVAAYPGDAKIENAIAERRLRLFAGTGRLGVARGQVGRVWESSREMTALAALLPALFGYGDDAWLAAEARRFGEAEQADSAPGRRRRDAYWGGLLALARGDAAGGRAALRRAAAPPTAAGDTLPRGFRGALHGAGGWARLVEGDTAAALRLLEEGIALAGYEGDGLTLDRPMRVLHLRLLARRPARRDEAVDRLRGEVLRNEGLTWAWWRRELADLLAAGGDTAGAAAERRRFAALWAGADPAPRR